MTYYALMISLIWGGGIAGMVLGEGLDYLFRGQARASLLNSGVLGFVGLLAGWLAYSRFCRPILVKKFRKRMVAYGLDTRFDYALTFDDEAIKIVCGEVVKTSAWSAVTEVFKAKDYWVFLVQMEPWFAPTRFFASAADEKAFVGSALAHLSDAARDRSKAATEFATG